MSTTITKNVPEILRNAIVSGVWHDPGSSILQGLLRIDEPCPLRLYQSVDLMESVMAQICGADGYAEYFGFVDNAFPSHVSHSRLVMNRTLLIGGDVMPGDDVLLALKLDEPEHEMKVYWFDVSRPEGDRWYPTIRLSSLIAGLALLRKS